MARQIAVNGSIPPALPCTIGITTIPRTTATARSAPIAAPPQSRHFRSLGSPAPVSPLTLMARLPRAADPVDHGPRRRIHRELGDRPAIGDDHQHQDED